MALSEEPQRQNKREGNKDCSTGSATQWLPRRATALDGFPGLKHVASALAPLIKYWLRNAVARPSAVSHPQRAQTFARSLF
ncbi:MAG: hypothetical protein HC862_04835 [Scytonema sp. RU_4_4]|nr:hypothetical protein [Scytonema sp. RU_4_4]